MPPKKKQKLPPPAQKKATAPVTKKATAKGAKKKDVEKFDLPCPHPGFSLVGELHSRHLDHVLERIFSHLDRRSFAQCFLVCRKWAEVLRTRMAGAVEAKEAGRRALTSSRPVMVDIARGLSDPPPEDW